MFLKNIKNFIGNWKLEIGNSSKKAGFSLVEVMFSVCVLSIGIVAVLSLMTGNIKNSIESRDAIIASELAQEGIELVRNVRDNNFVNVRTAFEQNFPNNDRDNCKIDKGSDNITDCNSGHSKVLNYSSGFYIHGSGTATKFQRKIAIDYDTWPNPVQATITSTVWWNGSSSSPASCNMATKCIYVEDILTDWAN
ncbi:MAG: prepilin-type N-terminal cleavage/methylation domain-containing protein [Patescibacteria group bacterium]